MAGKAGKIVAYVLGGALLIGNNAACDGTRADWVELGTAIAKVPAQVAYRAQLRKYKNGDREKKPVATKTLVDALRVAYGVSALTANWGSVRSETNVNVWLQKYTLLWTAIDSAKLLMDILPSKLSERIVASCDDDEEYLSSSFLGWVNEKVNDSKYLNSLGLYVLPALEEIITVWSALDVDKTEAGQLKKMYLAATKGAIRSLNELLDTKNPKLRTGYFILFLAHFVLITNDAYGKNPMEEAKKKDEDERKQKELKNKTKNKIIDEKPSKEIIESKEKEVNNETDEKSDNKTIPGETEEKDKTKKIIESKEKKVSDEVQNDNQNLLNLEESNIETFRENKEDDVDVQKKEEVEPKILQKIVKEDVKEVEEREEGGSKILQEDEEKEDASDSESSDSESESSDSESESSDSEEEVEEKTVTTQTPQLAPKDDEGTSLSEDEEELQVVQTQRRSPRLRRNSAPDGLNYKDIEDKAWNK